MVALTTARDSVVTSRSPRNTLPAGGSHNRASTRPSVVLPLPVGPTTATVSPGATSKLTPFSTGTRPGYANVTSAKRIPGGPVSATPAGEPVRSAPTGGSLGVTSSGESGVPAETIS